jgi:hypothetical protein
MSNILNSIQKTIQIFLLTLNNSFTPFKRAIQTGSILSREVDDPCLLNRNEFSYWTFCFDTYPSRLRKRYRNGPENIRHYSQRNEYYHTAHRWRRMAHKRFSHLSVSQGRRANLSKISNESPCSALCESLQLPCAEWKARAAAINRSYARITALKGV